MELEASFELEHLLFKQRKCKMCGETKELINDFIKQEKIEEMCHQHMHMNVKGVRLKGSQNQGRERR